MSATIPRLRVAVDIGGTFTDLAAFDAETGRLFFGKALSTHEGLVGGIAATVADAGVRLCDTALFLHGSTIAINTLLERTGAKTALAVTRGFRDIYEIGRINRPDAYNLRFVKHVPLIERAARFEVDERLLADGSVRTPLDEEGVRAMAEKLVHEGFEALAIMCLHSYRDGTHERRIREIVSERAPQLFISASHELTQEYREFERTSTVAANAYVGPRVAAYLGEIEDHLGSEDFNGDFYAVQSSGGLFPIAQARSECVRMLESGPAAGVIGAQAISSWLGLPDAVAFDMGGTTAKAGVIRAGAPLMSGHALIGAYDRALPIQMPMIDIFEVGTGGGSIAAVTEGGALRVGPRSAGSSPGPACYGRGGHEPTVTDANLVLGRLSAERFLGGAMPLDAAAAQAAIDQNLARPLAMDMIAAAEGVVQIAVTAMGYAVKAVTTERGLDIGAFAMIVYGGAGPLHATAIAREIGVRRVIVPPSPGHFSAFGMLHADLRHDFVRSCFEKLDTLGFDRLEALYEGMEAQGHALIESAATRPDHVAVTRSADMRYVGQEHAVTVELPRALFEAQDRAGIKQSFDTMHRERYGVSAPEERAELVSLRVSVVGALAHPKPSPSPARQTGALEPRAITRSVFRATDGAVATPVYDRAMLKAGDIIAGPALIEEHASTTVLFPVDEARVDRWGILDISIGAWS